MNNTRSVLESDRNSRLFSYYQSKCEQSRLPSRGSLNLLDVHKDLPYLYVSDVVNVGGETRFKFRQMGTKLVDIIKHEGTGQFTRELPLGGWEREWRKTLLYVMDNSRPAVALDILKLPNGLEMELEHLALPLSDDGKTVSHILGAIDFLGYDYQAISEKTKDILWSDIVDIEVPKRLIITNLAIDLGV